MSSQHSTWEMSHPAASQVLVSALQDGVGSEQSVSSQQSTWEGSHPGAVEVDVGAAVVGIQEAPGTSSHLYSQLMKREVTLQLEPLPHSVSEVFNSNILNHNSQGFICPM